MHIRWWNTKNCFNWVTFEVTSGPGSLPLRLSSLAEVSSTTPAELIHFHTTADGNAGSTRSLLQRGCLCPGSGHCGGSSPALLMQVTNFC